MSNARETYGRSWSAIATNDEIPEYGKSSLLPCLDNIRHCEKKGLIYISYSNWQWKTYSGCSNLLKVQSFWCRCGSITIESNLLVFKYVDYCLHTEVFTFPKASGTYCWKFSGGCAWNDSNERVEQQTWLYYFALFFLFYLIFKGKTIAIKILTSFSSIMKVGLTFLSIIALGNDYEILV